MSITEQEHGKFKIFTGTLGAGNSIDALGAQVEAFVSSAKVAPKSVGIEFLESKGTVVLTIGYRDDEPGYEVSLSSANLGVVTHLDAAGIEALEKKMGEAARGLKNVICHELLVTDQHEFVMVFLRHK